MNKPKQSKKRNGAGPRGPFIMQCDQTRFGKLNKNGVVSTIYSLRNRPNDKGIVHKYGKKAGQLKKNKLINE